MGLRFRKSINLGCGLRVNLSRSGIGYSWGTKGFRITKSPKGRVTRTYSIPGTGISYSASSGSKAKSSVTGRSQCNSHTMPHTNSGGINNNSGLGETSILQNAPIDMLGDEEYKVLTESAKKYMILKNAGIAMACIGIALIIVGATQNEIRIIPIILGAIFFLIGIASGFFCFRFKPFLEYTLDDESAAEYQSRLNSWKRLMSSKGKWRVNTTAQVINKKINAGASNSITRTPIFEAGKLPCGLSANIPVYAISIGNETLVILPDRLIVATKSTFAALKYESISFSIRNTTFIESQMVPSDTTVIGYTWKYVNKNGSPDKRFQDNRQIPKCQYAEISITSSSGMNTVLMISCSENLQGFRV